MPPVPASPPIALASPERRTIAAVAIGLVGVALFAGTLPATRLALGGFGPFFITFGRAALAGVIAGAVLIATRRPLPARADFLLLVLIAACLTFGFPFFTAMGMRHVPASHGSVVLAIMPLGTAVAAALVGGERPGLAFWLCGVAGAALVLAFSVADAGGEIRAGDLYLIAAAASAALGYALSGRLARKMPGWAVISWVLVVALPATTPLAVLAAPAEWPTEASVWGGFLYLAVCSMFLGFFFWNVAMALGGIAKIGQLQLLQPFVTMAIAAAIGGETVEGRQIAFAAVVVAVVAAAQRMKVARR